MKPFFKLFSFLLLSFFFLGCSEVRFHTVVLASELQNSKEHKVSANMAIEVDSCENRRDSYKDSGTIRAVKKMMNGLFIDANFTHCQDNAFTSLAFFELPIYINDGYNGNNYIKINSDENGYLNLFIPQALTNSTEAMFNSKVDPKLNNISFKIVLINDTKESIKALSLAAFVDGEPAIFKEIELSEGSETTISVSNIALSDVLLNEKTTILK